jgi:hypothetical protein
MIVSLSNILLDTLNHFKYGMPQAWGFEIKTRLLKRGPYEKTTLGTVPRAKKPS